MCERAILDVPDLAVAVECAMSVPGPEDVIAPKVPGDTHIQVAQGKDGVDPIRRICAPLPI